MRRTTRTQLTTAVVLCLSAMAAGGCSSNGGMKRGSASGDGLDESLHGLLPSSECGGDAAAESCSQHADCQSLVCDTYAAAGRGRCIDAGRVLYVDASHCNTPDGGTGTRDDPFCQIRTAVTAAAPSRDVIRVMPGHYFPFSVAGKRLLVFGPAGENGVARVFEEDTGTVRVSEGSDALVDGFVLGGPSTSALSCNSTPGAARVAVRRSTLSADSGVALNITGCDVEVDRVQIRAAFGGITLTNSRYGIKNAFVTGSPERVAIRVNGGEGSFRFVTVTGNFVETAAQGPFQCGDSPVLIQDSIVAGNGTFGTTASQFQGACILDRVVVGPDATTSDGAIHETPILEDGYRLPFNAENLACCIDLGDAEKSVLRDLDGTDRPQGPRNDVGAFEVVQ